MNAKLQAIAAKAASDLIGLVHDGEEKIQSAWTEALVQAQLEDTKPKFKLSVGITLDLDKDTMDTDLSWSTKHRLSVSAKIPDPTQPDLPMDDTTITLSVEGRPSVTVPLQKFHDMVAAKVKGSDET